MPLTHQQSASLPTRQQSVSPTIQSATRFSADTLAANAFPADSLAADTLLSPHDRFVAAEEDMLLLIAHCEGVRTRAYWDPNGKKWTIGIGNTVRPDGARFGVLTVSAARKN